MGYMENSYTNSNNGGSVNSQDSLWQMKMAAAANNGGNIQPTHQPDRQSNYGYDPITHGGYGAIDDYAAYPQLGHAGPPDAYMRASQNPSRQEYCSDPYASVHKPKKRMDQHIGKFYLIYRLYFFQNIFIRELFPILLKANTKQNCFLLKK